MAECVNCHGSRVQGRVCLDCGAPETTEKPRTSETTARKRPARKTTVERR